jgi:hypothetical protein
MDKHVMRQLAEFEGTRIKCSDAHVRTPAGRRDCALEREDTAANFERTFGVELVLAFIASPVDVILVRELDVCNHVGFPLSAHPDQSLSESRYSMMLFCKKV